MWIFRGYSIGVAGRPPKKKSERRNYTLRIRLTDGERKVLEGAADGAALDVSAWARMVLFSAAKQEAARPATNRASG